MPPPRASERARRPRRGYRAERPAALLGASLAVWSAHCTFPEYDTLRPDAAGTAGTSADTGAVAGQGATASLGGADTMADGGVGGTGLGEGGSFECGGEQWPLDLCEGGCLRKLPDSCYDGVLNGSELGVDCGGECQRCTNEACTAADDCLSGECLGDPGSQACAAPVRLVYSAHEQSVLVGSMAWSMDVSNAAVDGRTFVLKELEVRYYLARNGVVEPIVVRATQSNLMVAGGDNLALGSTSWSVERFEGTEQSPYDAYISVRFGDPGQLLPGDQVTLYQQVLTGEPGVSTFDQRLNYSFKAASELEWLHINVFYQGELLWGLEPRPAKPRACFVRGVNLNGPPVSAAGHDFESAAQAAVTTTGSGISQGNTPYPLPSAGLTTLLQTATRLQAGQSLELPTANGQYLAYLYAVSTTNDATSGTLTVQGIEHTNSSKFRAQAVESGWGWSRLGPYRIDVTTGMLSVAVTSGAVHFAGIELWYPE